MSESSQANLGKNAVLKWNGTAVAELKGTIPHVEISVAAIDKSNRDYEWDESAGGRLSGGELTVSGNMLPGDAAQIAMRADAIAKTTREVVIENTTAGWSLTFDAWIAKLGGESPDEGNAESFSVTLHPTGEVVYAATASTGLSALTGIEEEAGGALDLVPDFDAAVYSYNVLVNTASTWVKFTPTAAGVITITCGTQSQTVATTEQSTAITIGAADTQTEVDIKVKETGKTAKVYKFFIARP